MDHFEKKFHCNNLGKEVRVWYWYEVITGGNGTIKTVLVRYFDCENMKECDNSSNTEICISLKKLPKVENELDVSLHYSLKA